MRRTRVLRYSVYIRFLFQKNCQVTGYRFGDLAYLTDMSHYDEQIVDYLQGVNTIIVSASLGVLPKAFGSRTPSHLTLEQADLLMEKVGASRLVITHVSHYLHKVLERMLHESVHTMAWSFYGHKEEKK